MCLLEINNNFGFTLSHFVFTCPNLMCMRKISLLLYSVYAVHFKEQTMSRCLKKLGIIFFSRKERIFMENFYFLLFVLPDMYLFSYAPTVGINAHELFYMCLYM